jgi:hypothetical protein
MAGRGGEEEKWRETRAKREVCSDIVLNFN